MMLGVSQEALAGKLGLTFQQIQKYEKGQNRIGASRLYRIAVALGAPVEAFFEGLDASDEAAQYAGDAALLSFVSSPEGLALNMAFSQISSPATRRKVVDLVTTLAQEP